MRRIGIFTAILLLLGNTCICSAAAPTVSAQAYVLIDAHSGRVLCGANETERRSIASTTKVMTALVAVESGHLGDMATVKQSHLKEGSSMYLAPGEKISVEALLYGLLLSSGNDAAECIADTCTGSVDVFVAQMNAKAKALGLQDTSYQNPSGLEGEGHYSSAFDLARLMAYAMEDPTFVRITSTKSATTGKRMLSNHNKLLASVSGCIGGKTGYTMAAGRTLVSCAERDGMRLVAVTLNDGNDWDDHRALYDYGFACFTNTAIVCEGEACAMARVRGAAMPAVSVAAQSCFCYPLAEGESAQTEVRLRDDLTAPLARGDAVGVLTVSVGGKTVAEIPLVCTEDVPPAQTGKSDFLGRIFRLFS